MSEKLLADLTALRTAVENPKNWDVVGICNRIPSVESRAEFRKLVVDWPHFSGNPFYPVPGDAEAYDWPEGATNEEEAARFWDRKNSQYAEYRWQLIEWAIARLESQTKISPSPIDG